MAHAQKQIAKSNNHDNDHIHVFNQHEGSGPPLKVLDSNETVTLLKKYGGAWKDVPTEHPRIILLQGQSTQVQKLGMRVGDFFHTVLEESLGNEIDIVPISMKKQFILWNPRHDGGGILARAEDGVHWEPANTSFCVKIFKDSDEKVIWRTANTVKESGLDLWGSSYSKDPTSQPAATEMYTFLCAFPENPELGLALISFQRTQIKTARKWLTAIKLARYGAFSIPPFAQKYRMRSVEDMKKGHDFKNIKLIKIGHILEDKELLEWYANLYERYGKTALSIGSLDQHQEMSDGALSSYEANDTIEY